jgi:hypothetical protein
MLRRQDLDHLPTRERRHSFRLSTSLIAAFSTRTHHRQVRLTGANPTKASALVFRMQALARLMLATDGEAPGWTIKGGRRRRVRE